MEMTCLFCKCFICLLKSDSVCKWCSTIYPTDQATRSYFYDIAVCFQDYSSPINSALWLHCIWNMKGVGIVGWGRQLYVIWTISRTFKIKTNDAQNKKYTAKNCYNIFCCRILDYRKQQKARNGKTNLPYVWETEAPRFPPPFRDARPVSI